MKKGNSNPSLKTRFKKGHTPWNKSFVKKECLHCKKIFGISPCRENTAKYCSYRCGGLNSSWTKSGKEHPSWKGDDIKYAAIHNWLRSTFGKANKCESLTCNGRNSRKYTWSLLKGKEYQRKRENFWMLCYSCHTKYDFAEETKLKIGKAKKKYWANKLKNN